MNNRQQPLLTIGMIFKDDIRCLERCLRALEPLRAALPCELVMADTGSADGSREIAARYADILFDFPWIDDFSAARNAVMDRASGKWYLTVDTDEYLDSDISELTAFLRTEGDPAKKNHADRLWVCSVVQRNYDSYTMDGDYADFTAVRMLRMSTGLRYEGIIHENWHLSPEQLLEAYPLSRTILHHDGYANSDSEHGTDKKRRNMKLLEKKLAKDPKDLTALLQYVESSRHEPEHPGIVRHAMTGVNEKWTGWQYLGATICRHAVRAAAEAKLPEFTEWVAQAEKKFPDSFFTRIDVEYIAFSHDWNQNDYVSCIRRGEECLKAYSDYRNGRGNQKEMMYGPVLMSAPYWEQGLKIFLANAWLKERNLKRCKELLEGLDWIKLDEKQTENFIRVLREYHSKSQEDTAFILMSYWQSMRNEASDKKNARKHSDTFYRAASASFASQSQKEEEEQEEFCRPSYTLFLPLKDKCDIGRAAAILDSKDIAEIQRIIAEVEDWGRFPAEALLYALVHGIDFPLPDHPLKLEDMDNLAGRMTTDKEGFYQLLWHTAKQDVSGDLQKAAWLRGLVLAAVQTYDWDTGEEQEQDRILQPADRSIDSAADHITNTDDTGMHLARLFARTEREFIDRYYHSELLCQENICLLPPLHRLGWYCARAFQNLDNGDPAGYVRNLRAGLESCREGKAMVEYLTEHTPEIQRREVPAELAALAEQVRKILSAYPVNAPEIQALKASPVYQQVAWLIEKE